MTLLRTPLHKFHVQHGAKMVEFAGWEMPILYNAPDGPAGSITGEHEQVRRAGGIFDVSHMGRVEIKGREALRLVERLCTRRISDMRIGQCRYTLVCNEQGGIKDDVLVYRLADDKFLLVVNASNREKLLIHFEQVKDDLDLNITDKTLKTAMLAIQGPMVMDLIARFSSEIPQLKRYRFMEKNLLVAKALVSRTGYTGEDGVEAIIPANMVDMAMKLVLKEIDPDSPDNPLVPAGLGARDTLRLEAGMPLYGNELGEDVCALATGLDFAITLDKDQDEGGEPFIGQGALKRVRDTGGTSRTLVGLNVEGKRTPRPHMKVQVDSAEVGEITSGCMSPTLGRAISMAYVDRAHCEAGTALQIDTGRGEPLHAEVTGLPFYKRPKKA